MTTVKYISCGAGPTVYDSYQFGDVRSVEDDLAQRLIAKGLAVPVEFVEQANVAPPATAMKRGRGRPRKIRG